MHAPDQGPVGGAQPVEEPHDVEPSRNDARGVADETVCWRGWCVGVLGGGWVIGLWCWVYP